MEFEYIIVQAGGKGTRMEHLTENKPKALVPINNLPMIFHLFSKYPDKKFLIIGDYKSDVMSKYLEAFAKVIYLVIETKGKKGTCSGIKQAINRIPDNKSFMLIWSDLVLAEDFEIPEKKDNYIGLSKDFRCRWRYQDDIFNEIPSDNLGVAGLFIYKNKSQLLQVPQEGEFVKWMKEKGIVYKPIGLYKTKEYGLISEWNKVFDSHIDSRCRPFNSMKVDGDVLIKEGTDDQGRHLAVRECAWYEYVQNKGFNKIPHIYSYNPLKMRRIKGHNIFEYNLSFEEKKTVLHKLVNILKELHSYQEVDVDYFSIDEAYVGKTFDRLSKIRDLVPFTNQEFITVNGRKCKNIFFYKERLRTLFSEYNCNKFVLLHGDNTFSNMMLDEYWNPILIDPRGYFGHTELFGDPTYDWAKLYYSLVGNYDQFNLKRFRLQVKENQIILDIQSNGWEKLEKTFFELLPEEVSVNDIKLIHAIIWLSLTTYAWEDYDSICGAFYNGIYYLEEVL